MSTNFVTAAAQKRLLKDVKDVLKNPLTDHGIYYIHDEQNIMKGYACIMGPSDTIYKHGAYLFTFEYPSLKNKWRLAALLHDSPEYVIGDLITPFKYALNNSYREVEENLMKAIYIRFGLPAKIPKSIEVKIKKIDKALAWYEAISVGGYKEEEAMQILKKPDLKYIIQKIVPLSPNSVAQKFLKKFNQILFQINQ